MGYEYIDGRYQWVEEGSDDSSSSDSNDSVSGVSTDPSEYYDSGDSGDSSDSSGDSSSSDSSDSGGSAGGGWAADPTGGMSNDGTDSSVSDDYGGGGASVGGSGGGGSSDSDDSSDSGGVDGGVYDDPFETTDPFTGEPTDSGGSSGGSSGGGAGMPQSPPTGGGSSDPSDSGGLEDGLPDVVGVGESVEGVEVPGRYENPVDITRLHITEPEPMRGGSVPVSMEFTNRMDSESVQIREPIRVNGELATTANATIAAGDTIEETAEVPVPVSAGSFTIEVAGTTDTRSTSDYLGGRNLNLAPDPPEPGQTVHLYVTWVNQIDQYIERTLPVKVGGTQVDTHTVSIAANGTQDDKVSVQIGDGEQYSVDVGPAHVDGNTTAWSGYNNADPEQGTWTDGAESAQGSGDAEQGQLVDEGDVQDGEVVDDNLGDRNNGGADDSQSDSSGGSSDGSSGSSDPSTGSSIDFGDFGDPFETVVPEPDSEVGGTGINQRQIGMAAVAVLALAAVGDWP